MKKFIQNMAYACASLMFGLVPIHLGAQALQNSDLRNATNAEITTATAALNQFFVNRETGAGFVRGQKFCPRDENLPVSYGVSFEFRQFDKNSGVVLVHTMSCPQGNGVDEYIVYIKDKKARVVANDVVGVFKLMGDEVWGVGDDLFLRGRKWLEDDPHCCPSLTGILKYNLKNGRNFFEIEKN